MERINRSAHHSPKYLLLSCLLLSLFIGCLGEGAGEGRLLIQSLDSSLSGTIELTGSSTVAPIMSEIGKRFERLYPKVRVNVQMGGSSRGIADVRRGLADVGMVSRDLNVDEADLYACAIARDGICVIVHADNPVAELSIKQVVDIYTNRVHRWNEVGGLDAPITVVNKAEGRSTFEVFAKYFDLNIHDISADVVIGDNQQGIKIVAGNQNAIGYVSVGAAESDRSVGTAIKLLPVKGVAASVQAIREGSFPIARTLNLVTKSKPTGTVKVFLDFAKSYAVHDLVKGLSFVPIEH